MSYFEIRQCGANSCRFRFPWTVTDPPHLRCPRCGGPVQVVRTQSLAKEIETAAGPPVSQLQALVDNVRSTFNVGSILRSADGVGLQQLYLCGITPPPTHPKVKKTALGAEQQVSWTYHPNSLDLAQTIKAGGGQLWALEETSAAESLFTLSALPTQRPVVLIVGNEVTGVDPDLLASCDRTFAIPMQGLKRSLNVAIAFSVAVYWLRTLALR